MKENRSHFTIRLAAAKRLAMLYGFSKRLNLVVISEYPKSGGTWLSEMVSDVLDIPFPKNRAPALEECVMHAHVKYHRNFGKMIGLIRDGRDVIVSAYYHFLFENERNPSFFVKDNRRRVQFQDYNDIESNLPKFIEYIFNDYSKRGLHISWSETVRSFMSNENVLVVKYEDLLTKAEIELESITKFLGRPQKSMAELQAIVEDHAFQRKKKDEGQARLQ